MVMLNAVIFFFLFFLSVAESEPPFFSGLSEPGFLAGAGAEVFGWSRSRNFHPAPAPTPTLQYLKYFVFTGPDYDYDYDCANSRY